MGLEVGAASPRRWGRAGSRTPGCARGGFRARSPGAPSAPCPWPGLPGTLPALPLATSARATSSRPVLPPGLPPGLGAVTGGRGRTRRAKRLEARAGERARREGAGDPVCRPALLRSVGHPEGRLCRGWGGRAESAPGGGREGPRGPSGARGGAGGRPAWEEPVTLGGKWGLGLCPRTSPKVRSWWEPEDGPGVRADGAGPLGGAVGGEASRSARLDLELFGLNSRALPDQEKQWHFVQSVQFADFLESYNFFSFHFF